MLRPRDDIAIHDMYLDKAYSFRTWYSMSMYSYPRFYLPPKMISMHPPRTPGFAVLAAPADALALSAAPSTQAHRPRRGQLRRALRMRRRLLLAQQRCQPAGI